MGLDMYLKADMHLHEKDARFDKVVKTMSILDTATQGVFHGVDISFTCGYWRKANSIHSWFVKSVQDGNDDCGRYFVSREQLTELRDLCEEVLSHPDSARDVLPTAAGFFFGDQDYNEWYMLDLKDTILNVNRALNLMTKGYDIYYQSSW